MWGSPESWSATSSMLKKRAPGILLWRYSSSPLPGFPRCHEPSRNLALLSVNKLRASVGLRSVGTAGKAMDNFRCCVKSVLSAETILPEAIIDEYTKNLIIFFYFGKGKSLSHWQQLTINYCFTHSFSFVSQPWNLPIFPWNLPRTVKNQFPNSENPLVNS